MYTVCFRASRVETASADSSRMPSDLPTTSPATIAAINRSRPLNTSSLKATTPTLAKANSGSTR
jgi:hypothetical protein